MERHFVPWIVLTGLLSMGWWAPAVLADECTSVGPRAWVDSPRGDWAVPPSVRPRICLAEACGGVAGGPDHTFRLHDASGNEVPFTIEPWGSIHVELVPSAPLAAGGYTLQVRRPISTTELGAWADLETFTVAGDADTTAPALGGLSGGSARAAVGDHFVPPDMLETGWVVEITVEFTVATDGDRPTDELLYVLDRRAEDGAWELEVAQFRAQDPAGPSRHTWDRETGWGEVWEYRLRVRDVAGHETTGASTVTVTNPARPRFDLSADPVAPESCAEGGGRWDRFANTGLLCHDECDRPADRACGRAPSSHCQCGTGRCWDGRQCVED